MRRLALVAAMLVAACREGAAIAVPDPVAMSADALGYYCQMNLTEHEGPKAQIHLAGFPEPIFFGQVRDAVAFLHEPEKIAPVTAVYVSDMSRAPSWSAPGKDNWVAGQQAHFVVGSDAVGGMGAPELVPFSTPADAVAFAQDHGGEVLRLDDIPSGAVLGAVDRDVAQVSTEDRP